MSQPKIPKEVLFVTETLKMAQYEAFLVGGCVRDILMGKKPEDWDIATNAGPDKVQELFPHTFYENTFGTVGVVNDETEDESLKNIEVTTYRKEGKYSDGRRPDEIVFAKTIEEDLLRRDLTINAIALDLSPEKSPRAKRGIAPVKILTDILKDIKPGYKGHLVDPYNGHRDIKDKLIRAVLEPSRRFSEDALRIMRAVRFATVLDFQIEPQTAEAIELLHMKLKDISKERIRDEFRKIIMSKRPKYGLIELKKFNLLQFIIPELLKAEGVKQGGIHAYDVWEHSLKTVQAGAKKGFSEEIRLAALFHDIGKPRTRRSGGKNKEWTFFGHDVVGERVTRETLSNLKYPKEMVEKVSKLVRWHMFFSDTEEITHSAVRRMVRNVGKENIWDLINLRVCDRIGTGRPKEEPYRLRKYKSMIEEVMRDPISVGMLKIDGAMVMKVTHETPGPKIGYILNALLEEVLEDPLLNKAEYLEKRAVEMSKMNSSKLIALSEKGKAEKQKREGEALEKIRDKNWVK
ncbi:hypothetical protein COW82_03060 [Candidatus Campbellbacteria bacterium CG22_combo_CG10-13_8_21_14_all_43_18]|uniref:HD/PDEase domain-containing protein n=1 Tax=Candidatus Campbellbacteria bacterium CG22_combo_CG10-13_8_21_14_all_43_18 TaxID=1974530 RepID=A0A2H0DX14_9BACT|nr:MAG: hypothetical protein COW82_03060 [Candidatus Campbellbacteria bacterium CG22_combo_CG10-13_8_21_14_all_43_18]